MFQDLMPFFNRIGWSLPLFLIAFVALWVAKAVYEKTETFGFNDQLTDKDNPAFGTALGGYLLGVTIALSGAFPDLAAPDFTLLGHAAGMLAAFGVLIAVLMRLSVWVVSRGVLHEFGVREELIRDRNVGAGAVLAGGCIASGLVLHGALTGNSDTWQLAFRDVIVFWAVGLAILAGSAWLFQHVVKFDVQKELETDNVPAGLSLGGFLVAVGIIIDAALANASSDLLQEIVITLAASVIGLGLLVCSAIIAARVFLPLSPVAKEIAVDRNAAVGLISAVCFIAVAILLKQVIVA